MYHDIRNSFTGGHTDTYHAFGENLKIYDVNSLYPAAMEKFDMPVDPINYFEGDLSNQDMIPKFGFYYVNVVTPKEMERPLLQVKVKTEHGLRTVAPLGEWNM